MTTLATTAPDEVRALSRLAFDELAGAIGGLEQFHRAIADRAFGAGPGAPPAKVAHDAIAGGVYAGMRGATKLAGRAADAALSQRAAGAGRAVSRSVPGTWGLGLLHGLIGDRLEDERPELVEPMSVRLDGEVVPLEREALARAFPAATPRVVVFVHGLFGHEHTWWIGAREQGGTYGEKLAADLGCTPVHLRYNTGRHISQNGRSLSELLDDLVAAWPVELDQLALVGHSMGGLVSRAACYAGGCDDAAWVRHVRHVVSLGSPHMGAPMAQAVHYASAALDVVPETRPMARFLRRRSGGIRDLRHGSLVDGDWRDRDPDALKAVACEEVPLLEGATHCFVSATLTRSARHPAGVLLGDTMVLVPSASGRSRTRRIPFRSEHGAHIGRTGHIALLGHPVVYAKLCEWLATPPGCLEGDVVEELG